jgi:hypothetical protein
MQRYSLPHPSGQEFTASNGEMVELFMEAGDTGAWNLLKKLEEWAAEKLPHRQAVQVQEWIADRRTELLAEHPDWQPSEEPEYESAPCGQPQPDPMREDDDD